MPTDEQRVIDCHHNIHVNPENLKIKISNTEECFPAHPVDKTCAVRVCVCVRWGLVSQTFAHFAFGTRIFNFVMY